MNNQLLFVRNTFAVLCCVCAVFVLSGVFSAQVGAQSSVPAITVLELPSVVGRTLESGDRNFVANALPTGTDFKFFRVIVHEDNRGTDAAVRTYCSNFSFSDNSPSYVTGRVSKVSDPYCFGAENSSGDANSVSTADANVIDLTGVKLFHKVDDNTDLNGTEILSGADTVGREFTVGGTLDPAMNFRVTVTAVDDSTGDPDWSHTDAKTTTGKSHASNGSFSADFEIGEDDFDGAVELTIGFEIKKTDSATQWFPFDANDDPILFFELELGGSDRPEITAIDSTTNSGNTDDFVTNANEVLLTISPVDYLPIDQEITLYFSRVGDNATQSRTGKTLTTADISAGGVYNVRAEASAGGVTSAQSDTQQIFIDRTLPSGTLYLRGANTAATQDREVFILASDNLEAEGYGVDVAVADNVSSCSRNLDFSSHGVRTFRTVQANTQDCFRVTDVAGNILLLNTSTAQVAADLGNPSVNSVILSSNSTFDNDGTLARKGDFLTLSFSASETLASNPTVTIAGESVTVRNTYGNTYVATLEITDSTEQGAVIYDIGTITNLLGNTFDPESVTTPVIVDTTPPFFIWYLIETAEPGVLEWGYDIADANGLFPIGAEGEVLASSIGHTGPCTAEGTADAAGWVAIGQPSIITPSDADITAYCGRVIDKAGNVTYRSPGDAYIVFNTIEYTEEHEDGSSVVQTGNLDRHEVLSGRNISLSGLTTNDFTISGTTVAYTNYRLFIRPKGSDAWPSTPTASGISSRQGAVSHTFTRPDGEYELAIQIELDGLYVPSTRRVTSDFIIDTTSPTIIDALTTFEIPAEASEGGGVIPAVDLLTVSESRVREGDVIFFSFTTDEPLKSIPTATIAGQTVELFSSNVYNPEYRTREELQFQGPTTVHYSVEDTERIFTINTPPNTYAVEFIVTDTIEEGFLTYDIGPLVDQLDWSYNPEQFTSGASIDNTPPVVTVVRIAGTANGQQTVVAFASDTVGVTEFDQYEEYVEEPEDNEDGLFTGVRSCQDFAGDGIEPQTYIPNTPFTVEAGTGHCFRARDNAGNPTYASTRDAIVGIAGITYSNSDNTVATTDNFIKTNTFTIEGFGARSTHYRIFVRAKDGTWPATATAFGTSGADGTASQTLTQPDGEYEVAFQVQVNGNFLPSLTALEPTSEFVVAGATPAVESNITLVSDNSSDTSFATEEDTLTLTFTTNVALESDPIVTIAGESAVVVAGQSNTYTATLEVTDSTNEGVVVYDIGELTSVAGNTFDPSPVTTSGATEIFVDLTPPTITVVRTAGTGTGERAVIAFVSDSGGIDEFKIADDESTCSSSATGTFADYVQNTLVTVQDSTEDCFRAIDMAGNIAYVSTADAIVGVGGVTYTNSDGTPATGNNNLLKDNGFTLAGTTAASTAYRVFIRAKDGNWPASATASGTSGADGTFTQTFNRTAGDYEVAFQIQVNNTYTPAIADLVLASVFTIDDGSAPSFTLGYAGTPTIVDNTAYYNTTTLTSGGVIVSNIAEANLATATLTLTRTDTTGVSDLTSTATIGANSVSFADITSVPTGAYTASVTLTDDAGIGTTETISFVVDVTAPVITGITIADPSARGSVEAAIAVTHGQTLQETLTATLAGQNCSSLNAITLSGSGTTSTNVQLSGRTGTFTCTVTLTDQAGNTSSSFTIPTFTIERSSSGGGGSSGGGSSSGGSSRGGGGGGGVSPGTSGSAPTFGTGTPSEPTEEAQLPAPTAQSTQPPAPTQSARQTPAPTQPSLSRGSQGEQVRALQQFLNQNGYLVSVQGPGSPGQETTFFGPATEQALRAYQAANGLPVTGVFDPQTQARINPQNPQDPATVARVAELKQLLAELLQRIQEMLAQRAQ